MLGPSHEDWERAKEALGPDRVAEAEALFNVAQEQAALMTLAAANDIPMLGLLLRSEMIKKVFDTGINIGIGAGLQALAEKIERQQGDQS